MLQRGSGSVESVRLMISHFNSCIFLIFVYIFFVISDKVLKIFTPLFESIKARKQVTHPYYTFCSDCQHGDGNGCKNRRGVRERVAHQQACYLLCVGGVVSGCLCGDLTDKHKGMTSERTK